MRLGLNTAPFGDLTIQEVADWSAAHGWTHIVADLAVAAAYAAIPIALVYVLISFVSTIAVLRVYVSRHGDTDTD